MRKILIVALLLVGTLWAQADPARTVSQLYTYWVKYQNMKGLAAGREFEPVKGLFEPKLYAQLSLAYQHGPDDGAFVDVDPFCYNQMGGDKFTLGATQMKGGEALVPVTTIGMRDAKGNVTVHLHQSGGAWLVSDISYADGRDMLKDLADINKYPLKKKK